MQQAVKVKKAVAVAVAVCLLCVSGPGISESAQAKAAESVLVITSAPYADVSALSERLADVGYCSGNSLHVVHLAGDFAQCIGQLESFFSDEGIRERRWIVVAVGASALHLRWLLNSDAEIPVDDVVYVAAPNAGSVTAEMLYGEAMVRQVVNYRAQRDMHRRTADPRWSRPDYRCSVSYVAHRSRGLFEPLYHNFLVQEQLSLSPTGPESARSFLGWLAHRYPGRLKGYLLDSETPVSWDRSLCQLQAQTAGRTLSWGYHDLLAATVARFTYTASESAIGAMTEDMLEDVPLARDWRSALMEFARRRLMRFARNYLLPRLSIWARHRAVDWLQRQLEVDEAVLMYQIPARVEIQWNDTSLPVPANQLMRHMVDAEADSLQSAVIEHSVVVEAPNWLQLVYPDIGPNDWWTEIESASRVHPGGEARRVFLPVGGGVGRSERVAEEVLSCIKERPTDPGSQTQQRLTLDEMPVPGAGSVWDGDSRDPQVDEPDSEAWSDSAAACTEQSVSQPDGQGTGEIPHVRAVYRNKSTTLKSERRIVHSYWLWDFGDSTQAVDHSPRNTRGEKKHEFPGPGQYEVSAVSHASDGSTIRKQNWLVEVADDADDYRRTFSYQTAEEVVPGIELLGPSAWMTGKPAEYELVVDVDPPKQVRDLEVVCYPGCEFAVTWERPGQFWVKGAVNLRYSWQFADGTSRYFSVIYTEEKPVEVMATSLLDR